MTVQVCIIGWPVSHSRSPLIHGYWLKKYGIDGKYGRMPVSPEDLPDFIARLPGRYAGCNVTQPHKERVFELVEPADALTRMLGAVNTIFVRNGIIMGTNTDGEGFLANVAAVEPGWTPAGQRVLILGAGGAARAIAGALGASGASRVVILNRSRGRAERLRDSLAIPGLELGDLNDPDALAGADLLINTTSLGMKGGEPLALDLASLPRSALVADIVYIPLETDFLKRARARGHRTVPGLGMLLHQAVRGFELWFGTKPEVTRELRDIVAADIEAGTPA